MKKLWFNIVPGRDLNADQIFYYHQELPKYLRGFHKCTKSDAAKLAALVYRAKFDDDLTSLKQISTANLKEYVPQDIVGTQSLTEWKKDILTAYDNDRGISAEEAKSKFLDITYQWPTFGSTFFQVKQTSDSAYPENVTIAINKYGVNIIDPQTKVSTNFPSFYLSIS